jgi:predicted membrane-bound dolichyl-phosphate-mannose-protein mannosyltransferase
MEEKEFHPLESLLESGEEFGKTSFELLKLKTLDKTTVLASGIVFNMAVFILFTIFFVMGTLGIALWLGEILGKLWYGFFIVAGFYAATGSVVYFFMRDWIKKVVSNSIIKHVLK